MSSIHCHIVLIGIIVCAMASIGCNKEEPARTPNRLPALETVKFELNGTPVEIEIAYTIAESTQGLMYRDSMPDDHGMLFVYSEPRFMGFWMKNTKIPLSIAFIRDDLIVSNIKDMKPHHGQFDPTERYESKYQCLYALEMNQGWFVKHGIKAGDKIELPLEKIQVIIGSRVQGLGSKG